MSRHRLALLFPVGDDLVRLADTVQHLELLLAHLAHLVSGGAQVFAGVEFFGLLGEDLADGGRHDHAVVGVHVDFADAVLLYGHVDLLFGDAHGVFHLSAVLVDHVSDLSWDG